MCFHEFQYYLIGHDIVYTCTKGLDLREFPTNKMLFKKKQEYLYDGSVYDKNHETLNNFHTIASINE